MFTFNIIIPTIRVNKLLITCVLNCIKQTYNNFIVTIIIEDLNNSDVIIKIFEDNEIKYKIIKCTQINISEKRNIGAKSCDSKYLAFIDSDAYPHKKWLETALLYLSNENIVAIGGPSGISFPNENYIQRLTNLAKRSFFCTSNLSLRKYSTKNHYFDWIESCNFMIKKKNYEEINGMNKEYYIFEDLELCSRINYKYGKNKILFVGNLIVYHKDRNLFNFLKQRFVYGLHFQKAIKHSRGFSKFTSLIPLITFLIFFLYFPFIFFSKTYGILLLIIILISIILIYFDLKKFKINFSTLLQVTLLIYTVNLSYIFGNILSFFKFDKLISKRIYKDSQS